MIDETLQWLLDNGALEIQGYDDDDDPIFGITKECKTIAPEFYEAWVAKQNEIIVSLWQKNVVELAWADDDVYMTLTDNSFKTEILDTLTELELEVLADIVNDFAFRLEALERSEESEG